MKHVRYFMVLLVLMSIFLACKKSRTNVVMDTSAGKIYIKLYDNKSPETVKNFKKYMNENFYDGTIFHRVIDGVMIQTGGFTEDMQQKQTDAPIKNEASNGLSNEKGTIAMARTNNPDSATSQFFINTNNNVSLNYGNMGAGYCVFGKVTSGMDVVDIISKTQTTSISPYQNVPVEPIIILSITTVSK